MFSLDIGGCLRFFISCLLTEDTLSGGFSSFSKACVIRVHTEHLHVPCFGLRAVLLTYICMPIYIVRGDFQKRGIEKGVQGIFE